MQEALRILESTFHESGWDLEKPGAGNHDAAIATHGDRKVFLKFDVGGFTLRRLGTLQVAPALLASGVAHDRAYIIQEYIEGSHSDPAWFSLHLPDLAQFITRYHTDEELAQLLTSPDPPSYAVYIRQMLALLEERMRHARTVSLRARHAREAFHQLVQQADHLQPVPLVPTHADPNYTNFLLAGDHFYLIDWDDISLSDPMRDIGLLLWWYVPREQWPVFFAAYGMAINDSLLQRLYWWSAYTSLGVAQWFDAYRQDPAYVDAFLRDCVAALNREENPHRSPA